MTMRVRLPSDDGPWAATTPPQPDRHTARRRRRAVVLVEGASDQAAVIALAARRGRTLDSEGVEVVPIGGAKNIGHSSSGTALRVPTSG